jgi:hypothetical protein
VRADVAALYVMPNGPYPGLVFECWDEIRNAKHYRSKLRHLCTRQDPECGPRAVEQVQQFGGVLEHPANSKLWEHCALPEPTPHGSHKVYDKHGGFTYEVNQLWWGHPCVKPTWLYFVGVDWKVARAQLILRKNAATLAGTQPTHCVCTGPRQLKRLPVASKNMKKRTPLAFAEWLVSLAASARR